MAKELKEIRLTKVDIDRKLKGILYAKKISKERVDKLSVKERVRLAELIQTKLTKLHGTNKVDARGKNLFDVFFEKVQVICSKDTRNAYWEGNHQSITQAIAVSLQNTGKLPHVADISRMTKISRQTVYKHLEEFQSNPIYQEQMLKMKMLAGNVLAKVYQSAIQGDTGASKLFLNACGLLSSQSTSIKHQQNYIQINGLTLTQDVIQKLSPDQLLKIEDVLKQVAQPQAITQGNPINQ